MSNYPECDAFQCLGCGRHILALPPEEHAEGCIFIVTFEQMYPIAVPYLTAMRDSSKSDNERLDAAHWLIEHGLDCATPLAPKDEIRNASRGLFR